MNNTKPMNNSMNNTMLQNACSSKEAYPGHNCAIEILETDLQSLEGSDRIKLQQRNR